ncbi:MAG TPA: DNA repair protein, partial [Pseudorhodoferax sp.]|nr:DNA repair protein [Pseudorhodoferax sp.]
MQPLQLTLKGFRGIRDGLGLSELHLDLEHLAGGAQLIAITGANGSGKTTVMDNLTPYHLLASRAGAGSTGGFAYYDHVYLPESVKDLVWAHEGQVYRSQTIVRLAGRRRTEAFLHQRDAAGHWHPVVLDDGTISDGRMETYTACVEHLCGSAETFFTSVFAAQGKRQLNSYRNAEIKTLLADLLGQDQIRALGQQAAETARLLKVGLGSLRQQQAGLEQEAERLQAARDRAASAAQTTPKAEARLVQAQQALDAAVARHAQCMVEREQQRTTEQQRQRLQVQHRAEAAAHAQTLAGLQDQGAALESQQQRLVQRVRTRHQQAQERRQTLERARLRCVEQLAQAGAVRWAARRQALALRVLDRRHTHTQAARSQVQQLRQAQDAERLAQQQLAAIEREAGKAVLRVEELRHRHGLTATVPCAGSDLQGRCRLLGDAREAQALLPDARGLVARCARQQTAAQQALAQARRAAQELAGAGDALAWAEHREAAANNRAGRCAVLAAQAATCRQAQATLREIDAELVTLPAASTVVIWSAEDEAERAQAQAAQTRMAQQIAQAERHAQEARARRAQALAQLPVGCDDAALAQAAREVTAARAHWDVAHRAVLDAVREAQAADDLARQASALAQRVAQSATHGTTVEQALGDWTLLARCLSHDGLIALAIDDAGPTLSRLANDLLLACYGPRFTVAIRTLVATAKGDEREGFDIVVHDGNTGEAKSVGLMSGGERTF